MQSKSSSANLLGLLCGLAYELDSPLKSVLTRIDKLIHDYNGRDFEYISYKDFQKIFSSLEQLKRQLEYCSHTTSRMLYMGKRNSALKRCCCQVNDVIRDVTGILSQQLRLDHIKLVLRLKKNLPMAAVGDIDCHQIIHNVLINAIQAMPAGGAVRVVSKSDPKRGVVAVEISDEGIGITPEHLSRIFDPFFTTRERGVEKNAGLGLFIIHSILEAVGGSVDIKSSLRRGTSVHIAIPVCRS